MCVCVCVCVCACIYIMSIMSVFVCVYIKQSDKLRNLQTDIAPITNLFLAIVKYIMCVCGIQYFIYCLFLKGADVSL